MSSAYPVDLSPCSGLPGLSGKPHVSVDVEIVVSGWIFGLIPKNPNSPWLFGEVPDRPKSSFLPWLGVAPTLLARSEVYS